MDPYARRKRELDVVFVLDATNSTACMFCDLSRRVVDATAIIHRSHNRLDVQYGLVLYRDPVENPGEWHNKNEVFQLVSNRETIADTLSSVNCGGGGDDAEDWVGGFELALHGIKWRENSTRCLFWIGDACAHGSEYSYEWRDRHDDEAPKLTRLIQEAAQHGIYFVGVNIKRMGDPGCAKTLAKLSQIYEAAGNGRWVQLYDFDCHWEIDAWVGDEWPEGLYNHFLR
jgi:hypothetical protein